jgi:hypothetical protein
LFNFVLSLIDEFSETDAVSSEPAGKELFAVLSQETPCRSYAAQNDENRRKE